jgi:hypothetical protein
LGNANRSGEVRESAMRSFMSYVFAGVIVVVAMDAIAPPAGLGLAIGTWPDVDRNTRAQAVDRTHKSDRLRVPAANGHRPSPPTEPATLIGCEQVFSSLSASSRANFAGRCVA